MKKLKSNKAITLIALIITIIVLLILAVVAIRTIQGDGIIKNAKKAQSDYEAAKEREKEILSEYELILAQEMGKAWKQDKTIVSKGDLKLQVGDYVDYKAGVTGYNDNNGWRVLGEDNGKLLLISSKNIGYKYLSGSSGYFNGEDILNDVCKSYGDGPYAIEARSVNVYDINRVTGYDPSKTGNGKPYILPGSSAAEYGNEIIYTKNSIDGRIYFKGKNQEIPTRTGYTNFYMLNSNGSRKSLETEEYRLINNYYRYYPRTLIDSDNNQYITQGIDKDSNAYDLLFKSAYWLSSPYVIADECYAYWGMKFVTKNQNDINSEYYVGNYAFLSSLKTNDEGGQSGIRAVVSISNEANLEKGELVNKIDSWKIINKD